MKLGRGMMELAPRTPLSHLPHHTPHSTLHTPNRPAAPQYPDIKASPEEHGAKVHHHATPANQRGGVRRALKAVCDLDAGRVGGGWCGRVVGRWCGGGGGGGVARCALRGGWCCGSDPPWRGRLLVPLNLLFVWAFLRVAVLGTFFALALAIALCRTRARAAAGAAARIS